jgi:hypothetical protein
VEDFYFLLNKQCYGVGCGLSTLIWCKSFPNDHRYLFTYTRGRLKPLQEGIFITFFLPWLPYSHLTPICKIKIYRCLIKNRIRITVNNTMFFRNHLSQSSGMLTYIWNDSVLRSLFEETRVILIFFINMKPI